MNDYSLSWIDLHSGAERARVEELLRRQGIRLDANLDRCLGIFDAEDTLIATGSCFRNTLRCIAVSSAQLGKGWMEPLVSRLCETVFEQGYINVYVYTKAVAAPYFKALGFHEIVSIDEGVSFLEYKRSGFPSYLRRLSACRGKKAACAVVMNANPFTLGHRYLVEQAAKDYAAVHVFVVSEDCSAVPFAVRKTLVERGCADINGVCVHSSGDYIISSATFPSYFLEDESQTVRAQAKIDAVIFTRIAETLGVDCRYLGSEPLSDTTAIYNEILSEVLPEAGIACRILPRLADSRGETISASKVRAFIRQGRLPDISEYVPASTLAYFLSPEAAPVIDRIRALP